MIGTCCDTDDEAARVHLQLLRAASPAARLALALSISRSVIELSRQGIRRGLGGTALDEEVGLRFVELHYGPQLAEDLRRVLAARTHEGIGASGEGRAMVNEPDLVRALRPSSLAVTTPRPPSAR